MEFKATIIQTVIHGKAYLQGTELNLADCDLQVINILNLKRALCFFKKVNGAWVRSSFYEFSASLNNKESIETVEEVKKRGRKPNIKKEEI
jgi:hypothetical protein